MLHLQRKMVHYLFEVSKIQYCSTFSFSALNIVNPGQYTRNQKKYFGNRGQKKVSSSSFGTSSSSIFPAIVRSLMSLAGVNCFLRSCCSFSLCLFHFFSSSSLLHCRRRECARRPWISTGKQTQWRSLHTRRETISEHGTAFTCGLLLSSLGEGQTCKKDRDLSFGLSLERKIINRTESNV